VEAADEIARTFGFSFSIGRANHLNIIKRLDRRLLVRGLRNRMPGHEDHPDGEKG
jgi:hypothetical protein